MGSVAGRLVAGQDSDGGSNFVYWTQQLGIHVGSDMYRAPGARTPVPLLEGAEANGASGGKHTVEVRRVTHPHLAMGRNNRVSRLAHLG